MDGVSRQSGPQNPIDCVESLLVTRGFVHNIARVAFAVTGAVAMTYQFAKLNGNVSFSSGNFFSFFTIQSNIMAATMLVLTALVRRDERSRLFDALRGAVTFYITITFVVFALFLSGLQEDLDTHIAFVNFVVHYLIPIVLLVDWFLDPPRRRLGMGVASAWLAYPLAWFAYTLARGCWATGTRTRSLMLTGTATQACSGGASCSPSPL